MINRFFFGLIFFLALAAPSFAATSFSYGKGGGSFEIDRHHDVLSTCTRVTRLVSSANKMAAILFNNISSTSGCKTFSTGYVSGSMSTGSYQAKIRLYFTTTAQTSKVVGLGVRAYALVPDLGPERVVTTNQSTMTTGAARNFVADQINFVETVVSIKKQDGTACDSACNNKELILYVEPTASMTIAGDNFYLLGYTADWTH